MIINCFHKNKALGRILLLALIFITGTPVFAGGIEWRTDYMQARQEAAQKKPAHSHRFSY